MGTLKVINPTLLRLSCDCGKYVHEIRRGDNGDVELESFAKPGASAPADTPVDTPASKKRKARSFFDYGTEGE